MKIREINEIENTHVIWRWTKPNSASLKILKETNIVSIIKKPRAFINKQYCDAKWSEPCIMRMFKR